MSAIGGAIPVRSSAEIEPGSSDSGDGPGGVVIPLRVERQAPTELSVELHPISPELALVDPELARAARALLPDRPRFASDPVPLDELVFDGVVLAELREAASRAGLSPPSRPSPLSDRAARAGRRIDAAGRSDFDSHPDSVGGLRARGCRPQHAGPEACALRARSCSAVARADLRLGRRARDIRLRVPAVPERRTDLSSARRAAETRTPGPLAAGRPAARARAGRLPLVRLAGLDPDEAQGIRCDGSGQARGRGPIEVIRRRRLRRSTLLTGMTGLVAALLVAGAGSAEGAWLPKGKLALKRTLAADRVAPTKPRALTVVATTASSVTVSWRRSSDRTGVAGYTVYRGGVRIGSTSATRTRYVVPSLKCGTSHRIAVQAYDLAGNRSARAMIVAATSACVDTQAPSVPANLAQTAVTSSSITISWAASSDNFGVVGYEVLSDGALTGSTASTLYALTSLRCGAMYTIGVRALDAAGHRSAAASILVTTAGCPDSAAPSPPSSLRVTSVNQTSVSVRWSASTDDRGVVGYGVYRGSSPAGSTGATSYTVGSLSCGASYVIGVDAYDAAGNRSGRSTITATTSACPAPGPAPPGDTTPPSVPSGLTVSGATASTISLGWTASTDNTGVHRLRPVPGQRRRRFRLRDERHVLGPRVRPQLRPRGRRLRRERQPLGSPLGRLVHRAVPRYGAAFDSVRADPDRRHPIVGGADLDRLERQRRRRRLRDLPRRRTDRIDELARLHLRVADLRHDLHGRRRRLRRRRQPLRGRDALHRHSRLQRRHPGSIRSSESEHRLRHREARSR